MSLPALVQSYAGGAGVPQWIGPLLPEVCDPLYVRVRARFDELPCDENSFHSSSEKQ